MYSFIYDTKKRNHKYRKIKLLKIKNLKQKKIKKNIYIYIYKAIIN